MSRIASLIQIVALPHGDAPETVRRGWMDCTLPCEPECGHVPVYAESVLPRAAKGPLTVEEFRNLPPTQKIDGFSVPQDTALLVLECHSPLAAKWFYQHGFPHKDQCFRFKLAETKVLRTLSEQEERLAGPLAVYDDMETGTPRRVL